MRFSYNETHVHDVVIKHGRSHRVLARKLMVRPKTHAPRHERALEEEEEEREEEEEEGSKEMKRQSISNWFQSPVSPTGSPHDDQRLS